MFVNPISVAHVPLGGTIAEPVTYSQEITSTDFIFLLDGTDVWDDRFVFNDGVAWDTE